jgi:hypothetical protein
MTVGISAASGYWVVLLRSFINAALWYTCFAFGGMLLVSVAIVVPHSGAILPVSLLMNYVLVLVVVSLLLRVLRLLRAMHERELSARVRKYAAEAARNLAASQIGRTREK